MGVDINWNALQSFDIGGAFNQGMQAGQQRRREQETDNALRALIANPNDTNVVNDLAKYDPRAALQIQGQQAQQMRAQQEMQARQGAVRGDPQALEALAGFNIDDYLKLDKRSQEQYKQGIEVIGQAALMSDTPEEWDDTVRQLAQADPVFNRYLGRFDMRQTVIAQAGQAKEFIAQNEPKYMAPATDQDLVNVRDPKALEEFRRSREGRAAQSQGTPPANPQPNNPQIVAQAEQKFADAMRTKIITPEDVAVIRNGFGPGPESARRVQTMLDEAGIQVGKQIGGKTYVQRNGEWYEAGGNQ